MRQDKKNLKVKIPLIITGIGFATHLMPFVILFPLLLLSTIFGNELEIEVLNIIFIFLFLMGLLIYVINVFLAPVIQFVLAVVAVINKKWWLVSVHIVSVIVLCGGIVLFIEIFKRMAYAT